MATAAQEHQQWPMGSLPGARSWRQRPQKFRVRPGVFVHVPYLEIRVRGTKRGMVAEDGAGEVIGCFGLTEPDHGSDPSSMATRAKRDGDQWILNGSKRWITNAGIAHLAIVWANTDEGFRGSSYRQTQDSKPENPEQTFAQSFSNGEFYMDDVVVPESMRLHAMSIGAPLSCLSEARYGIAFGAVGVARDCYNAALNYQQERPQFGKPLCSSFRSVKLNLLTC